MKNKYTYELQHKEFSVGRWSKDASDRLLKSVVKKIDAAYSFKKYWCRENWRVVRKQGRKIVKVIYQTK